jgi:thiamine kinase-like enzyme
MVMDEKLINEIIARIKGELNSSLGEIVDFEIYQYEKLIFSEICKIGLIFKKGIKNVVCKKYIENELVNTERSAQKEYDILKHLHNKFVSLKGVNVVKPIALIAEDNIIVTEEFGGAKLNQLVLDNIRWIPSKRKKEQIKEIFYYCGNWLKYFHEFTKKDGNEILNYDHFIKSIEKILLYSDKYGLIKNMHDKIHQFIENKFNIINEKKLELVGCHNDFNTWNILATDKEIRVMDFDRFSYSNKYEDHTLFIATLEGMKSIIGMSHRNITLMQNAFIKGYGDECMGSDIIDLYLLKNILRVLTMIEKNSSAVKFIDRVYEKYRKKRLIRHYLKFINNFTNGLQ